LQADLFWPKGSAIYCLEKVLTPKDEVELGIYDARVPYGAHIAFFWRNENEFKDSVGFLEAGLKGKDYCIIVQNQHIIYPLIRNLLERECDVARLLAEGRLTILQPDNDAYRMATSISEAIQFGLANGARCVRLLGSPGWGDPGWPAEEDLIKLEETFTSSIAELPCVCVCLYDLRIVSDRIVKIAGAGAHEWEIRAGVVRKNPGNPHRV
jgi:hypothetical protein